MNDSVGGWYFREDGQEGLHYKIQFLKIIFEKAAAKR